MDSRDLRIEHTTHILPWNLALLGGKVPSGVINAALTLKVVCGAQIGQWFLAFRHSLGFGFLDSQLRLQMPSVLVIATARNVQPELGEQS